MLFNNNDGGTSDRILYKTKPNMILGCKKAIFGIILLIIILSLSSVAIKFIGHMQLYLISSIKLPLTKYVAIAFFVIILINVIYIIWQLIGWYSIEYILTDSKIIIKSGIISTKKNYMPYATIQDINTSQSIIAKLFNVGSVSVFSAYDNNQLELKDIFNPSEVEEIIFSQMRGFNNFHQPLQGYNQQEYYDDYFDEFEPITPLNREKNLNQYGNYSENFYNDEASGYEYEQSLGDYGYNRSRNDYERPRDNFKPSRSDYDYEHPRGDCESSRQNHDYIRPRNNFEPSRPDYEYEHPRGGHASFRSDYDNNHSKHNYKYEPYDAGYRKSPNNQIQDRYYNEVMDDYSHDDNHHYQNNESKYYYNEMSDEYPQDEVDDIGDNSKKVIQRHFDKFKK